MLTLFDHVFSPLKDNHLDAALRRFERAGFIVDADKARHRCGRLTGFVRLTGTYLELLSVVDEAEFQRDAMRVDRIFRQDPQPYGVGAIAAEPNEIYRRLHPIHPEMAAPAVHFAVGDETRRPRWTMGMMPRKAFPGTNVFTIKYHERSPDAFRLRQGPNTIFALGGFVFCTARAAEHRAAWRTTLELVGQNRPEERGTTLRVGGQEIEWRSPDDYRQIFGRPYNRMYEDLGAIAAVKLLCTDLVTAQRSLTAAGFELAQACAGRAYFHRDANTGFTFELSEADPSEFLHHHAADALVAR